MSENPYASLEPVAEEKSQRKKRPAVWRVARIVFCVHLVPILLVCGLMTLAFLSGPSGEEHMAWILFVGLDASLSLMLIRLIDGPTVGNWMLAAMGVPQHWWLLYEVIWPGVLFQIIGTLNWTAMVLLLRGAWKGLVHLGRE